MKDDDECFRQTLRQMIASAIEECTDTSLLDLVYKIITADDIQ